MISLYNVMGIIWRWTYLIYMAEINIWRNSSPKKLGVLRGAFKGMSVQKDTQTPCWLRPWVHGLSQQGVWVPFWTPKPLKRTPQDTQRILCGFSKNLNLKLIIEFYHLLLIPMTFFNDIMPYSDEFIHVYGWNMSILWSPLKIWTPKNFTTANFRHPVSKSWLRHWPWLEIFSYLHQARVPVGSRRGHRLPPSLNAEVSDEWTPWGVMTFEPESKTKNMHPFHLKIWPPPKIVCFL